MKSTQCADAPLVPVAVHEDRGSAVARLPRHDGIAGHLKAS